MIQFAHIPALACHWPLTYLSLIFICTFVPVDNELYDFQDAI